MKHLLFRFVTIGLLFAGSAFAEGFTLMSQTFRGQLPDNHVFNGFGCSGKNVSPDLRWSKAPKDTKSFALMMYDPDAPTGSGFWHWIVYNIPARIVSLPVDAGNAKNGKLPKGAVTVRNDYGFKGFGGACPPPADRPHRYILSLYALDAEMLELPDGVSAAVAGFNINARAIAQTSIIGIYDR